MAVYWSTVDDTPMYHSDSLHCYGGRIIRPQSLNVESTFSVTKTWHGWQYKHQSCEDQRAGAFNEVKFTHRPLKRGSSITVMNICKRLFVSKQSLLAPAYIPGSSLTYSEEIRLQLSKMPPNSPYGLMAVCYQIFDCYMHKLSSGIGTAYLCCPTPVGSFFVDREYVATTPWVASCLVFIAKTSRLLGKASFPSYKRAFVSSGKSSTFRRLGNKASAY